MTPALQQAVDRVWRVMDGPVPSSHQACTACCLTPENDDIFFRVPRREMPITLLDDWYSAAFAAPASPDLRRYMLPRVLDLLAQGTELGLGFELMLQRFDTGTPELWTEAQNAAIAEFEAAFLDAQAVIPSPWGSLDDSLCMFALAGHDVDRLLARIWAWADADLITRLHHDWCTRGGIWIRHTAFWKSDRLSITESSDKVMTWYRAPQLRERCFDVWLKSQHAPTLQTMAEDLYDGLAHV